MTQAAYIYPAALDYRDEAPDYAAPTARRTPRHDALGISLRVAGVVGLISGAAVVFGLSRIPDIDLNSAPGQPGYVAGLDAAGGAPGTDEAHTNGPLLVTLTEPNYDDPSIVHAAPLPAMYARASAMPSATPVNAMTSVSGDQMSRLIHGDDGTSGDVQDQNAQAQNAQAIACNEPCDARTADGTDGWAQAAEASGDPVAYVDGVPTVAAPVADTQ